MPNAEPARVLVIFSGKLEIHSSGKKWLMHHEEFSDKA